MRRALGIAALAAALAAVLAACARLPEPRPATTHADLARPTPPPQPGVSDLALGRRYFDWGRYEEAAGLYGRALASEGVSAAALTGAAVARMRLGRLAQAEKLLKAAVEVDPNSPAARNNLGVLLYELRDYAGAQAQFRSAFALSEGASPQVARNLELAEFALARRGDAAAADPPPLTAKPDLDWMLVRRGHGRYRLKPAPHDDADADAPPVKEPS